MAKVKADWLKEAKDLGLDVSDKNTVDEIKQAISAAEAKPQAEKAQESPATTKAGKRSAKGRREAAQKEAKEARKKGELDSGAQTEDSAVKKGPVPVPRPKIERHGKNYRQAVKAIDREREYEVGEAIKLALAASTTKFDASVELHVNLNVDPKQSDQNIRETVALPHGTGKTVRVAVFAPADEQAKAKAAGADFVGEDELIDKLKKEEFDFEVLIATPQLMSKLGQFAKTLGPKGLMPNPKSGTVTKNVATAVKQAKAGRVEFRIDKQGIVHVAIGKVSFGADKISDNAAVVLDAIKSAKPSSVKTQYLSSIYVTTSMGPSVRIAPTAITSA